jgi:hypothetical protein
MPSAGTSSPHTESTISQLAKFTILPPTAGRPERRCRRLKEVLRLPHGRLYAFGGEVFAPRRGVFEEVWIYDPAMDRRHADV